MIILNATRQVKMIMASNNKMITIHPGKESEVMIASTHLITAALNLGTEKEIGIILSGGYEFELAKQITAAPPYLYSSLEEARAKLIDPSINYQETQAEKITTEKFNKIVGEKDGEIKSLSDKIKQLETKLKESEGKSNNMDHIKMINEKEGQINSLKNQYKNLESQLKEAQDNLLNSEKDIIEYKKKLGENEQIIQTLTSQNSDSVSKEKYDSEVKELQDSLNEAVSKIESMRDEFNKVCEEFNLSRDEKGVWTQS